MDKSAKVAISLPRDVLEAVEMERKAKGESRSQFSEGLLRSFSRRSEAWQLSRAICVVTEKSQSGLMKLKPSTSLGVPCLVRSPGSEAW